MSKHYIMRNGQRIHLPTSYRYGDVPPSVTQSEPRLQETGIPLANLGIPIPYVIGTKKIGSPNSIWIGNLRPIIKTTEEIITEEEEKFVEGEQWKQHVIIETRIVTHTTVGYYISIQMGLCLGPDVRIRKIGIGEDTIWEGNVGPERTEFTIDPGDDVESYIQNDVIFQGGAIDQQIDPYIAEHTENQDTLAGYVGVAYIILRDVRLDQIRGSPWFEVERFTNPLGLSAAQNRQGADINIASALTDYLSSDWGGGALGMDPIDLESFVDSAERLAEEGNYCSFVITAEADAGSILDMLSDQAQGVLFEDPAIGKVKFKLLRFDQLNPFTTLKLNEETVTRVNSWNRRSWVGTLNKMRIRFIDREKLYDESSLVAYNFSALNDRIKRDRTSVADFPTIHSQEVARLVLGRILSLTGQPIASGTFEMDRSAADALPGDGMQLFLPNRGIPSVIGIVTKVRRFPLGDNRVVVSVMQLPRQDSDIVFDFETELSEPVRVQPEPPTALRVIQPPYMLARRAGMNKDTADQSNIIVPMFLPTRANNMQDTYYVYCVNSPGSSGLLEVSPVAWYPVRAQLSDPIDKFEAMDTGVIPSVTLYGVINGEAISNEGLDGVRAARTAVFIGNEVFGFESATDNGDGTWTLNNVHRAMMDTAPTEHAADADVFIIGGSSRHIGSPFNFPLSFTPAWRVSSNTLYAEGNPETQFLAASGIENPGTRRHRSPLRPHNTKINGLDRSDTLVNVFEDEIGLIITPGESLDITWATRDRTSTLAAIQLDAAQPSEIDNNDLRQQHRVMIRDSTNTLRDCGVTADDANYNSLTVTVPANTALGTGYLFVRAETALQNSLYEDHVPVLVMGDGFFVTEEDEDIYFRTESGTLGGDGIYTVELGGT